MGSRRSGKLLPSLYKGIGRKRKIDKQLETRSLWTASGAGQACSDSEDADSDFEPPTHAWSGSSSTTDDDSGTSDSDQDQGKPDSDRKPKGSRSARRIRRTRRRRPNAANTKTTGKAVSILDIPIELLASVIAYVCDHQGFTRVGFLIKLRSVHPYFLQASAHRAVWSYIDVSSALTKSTFNACMMYFTQFCGSHTRGIKMGHELRMSETVTQNLGDRTPNLRCLVLCRPNSNDVQRTFELMTDDSRATAIWTRLQSLTVEGMELLNKSFQLTKKAFDALHDYLKHQQFSAALTHVQFIEQCCLSNSHTTALFGQIHTWCLILQGCASTLRLLELSVNVPQTNASTCYTLDMGALLRHYTNLVSLSLAVSNNTLKLVVDQTVMNEIPRSGLRSIAFAGSRFDVESNLKELSELCPEVRELQLYCTDDRNVSNNADHLADSFLSLMSNHRLESITLRCIPPVDSNVLQPTAEFWRTLRHLSLTLCDSTIVNSFLSTIAVLPQPLDKLKTIELCHTRGEIEALRAALMQCANIERVDLTGCRIKNLDRSKGSVRRNLRGKKDIAFLMKKL